SVAWRMWTSRDHTGVDLDQTVAQWRDWKRRPAAMPPDARGDTNLRRHVRPSLDLDQADQRRCCLVIAAQVAAPKRAGAAGKKHPSEQRRWILPLSTSHRQKVVLEWKRKCIIRSASP